MSKEKDLDHELPDVMVPKFLSEHTDEQLKDICIDELRRIIPKLFLFLGNHDYRMSKKVKGLWDKPPVWWDDTVPFLDPNNCRRTTDATECGSRKKPTKRELLPMFFFLVEKCRCRLRESHDQQMELSPGSVSIDYGNHAAVHSIDGTKSFAERLLDEIENDVDKLSISSPLEKDIYRFAADSVRKMGSCMTTMDDESKIRLIENACQIKAAVCIHKTVGDVPARYKEFLKSLSGVVPRDFEENSCSSFSSIASGRCSSTVTGYPSTVSPHADEHMENAVEMASVKQDFSQPIPSTILYNTNVETDSTLCFGEFDVIDDSAYLDPSFCPSIEIERINSVSTSTSSYDVCSGFVGSNSSGLPILTHQDVEEVLSCPSDCMDSEEAVTEFLS